MVHDGQMVAKPLILRAVMEATQSSRIRFHAFAVTAASSKHTPEKVHKEEQLT